jgi:hypothetical protein
MARGRPATDLVDFARIGIQTRLNALDVERAMLEKKLTALSGRPGRKATPDVAAPKGKRRRRLSAEGRKRISEMMKKRWAERRKATGSK